MTNTTDSHGNHFYNVPDLLTIAVNACSAPAVATFLPHPYTCGSDGIGHKGYNIVWRFHNNSGMFAEVSYDKPIYVKV